MEKEGSKGSQWKGMCVLGIGLSITSTRRLPASKSALRFEFGRNDGRQAEPAILTED